MRAMVLESFGRPLRAQERTPPEPGAGEALVRVMAAGVAGFDAKVVTGLFGGNPPIVPGHEFAGHVEALGEGASGVAVGDLVANLCTLFCGACRYCVSGRQQLCANSGGLIGYTQDGGFAEYVRLPARLLCHVPEGVAPEAAATLGTSGTTVFHALHGCGRLQPGESVAITGAGGGLGVLAVQVARSLGAFVIALARTDAKLEQARALGADAAVNLTRPDIAAALKTANEGRGVDVFLDVIGSAETIPLAMASLSRGGRLVLLATGPGGQVAAPPYEFIDRELLVTGASAGGPADLAACIDLVARGRVTPVIAARYPLDAANKAVEEV